MKKEKIKTVEDLKHQEGSLFVKDKHISEKELKEAAVKFFLHGLKKRKNPYKMFMEFHSLKEGDFEKK